jgi:hypothetical protein
MKAKYTTSLTLDEEEATRTEEVRKHGRSIIGIYRLGLSTAEEQIKGEEASNDKAMVL